MGLLGGHPAFHRLQEAGAGIDVSQQVTRLAHRMPEAATEARLGWPTQSHKRRILHGV